MASPTNSQLIEADARLATVFSLFYCVQHSTQAEALEQQLLPNYEMLMLFNFGPAIPGLLGDEPYVVQQTAVLGPLQKLLTYTLPPGADLIVVNFTLNGFYRLLGVPMHQLRDAHEFDPDALINKSCFRDLWEEVAATPNLSDRLQRLSEYALTYLTPVDEATRSLMHSIPYFTHQAVDPIKALAETQRVSPRSIQLRFQTQLGYSAKELTRFLRFKKLLKALYQEYPAPVDWLNLVFTFGYHDHSHLIKDFQYFLGMTPRQFLRQLATGGVCISQSGKFYSLALE
ncbi:AraC family transcriptional regulator [Spirosoma koreense]